MSCACRIAGDAGNKLAIAVHGYENNHAENRDDANWLTCELSFAIAGFKGEWFANFTTYDFEKFHREVELINSNMEGRATFRTLEEMLELDLLLNTRGTLQVSGTLRHSLGEPRGVLEFFFESDQSYLQNYAEELGRIVGQYPVIGR